MRAKYIFEWFPPLIEEEISEVTIKNLMSEYEADMLKDELGNMLFGDQYQPTHMGNPELPSRLAGYLGQEVKKLKDTITTEKLVKDNS